jgi:hypothetical protein
MSHPIFAPQAHEVHVHASWGTRRSLRAAFTAVLCTVGVVAAALVMLTVGQSAEVDRSELLSQGGPGQVNNMVEFRVPPNAKAGQILDVEVQGAPAREVEIPEGAKPGESLVVTEPGALAAKPAKEMFEFEVPASGRPGEEIEVTVPGGDMRQVIIPAGAHPGEEISFRIKAPTTTELRKVEAQHVGEGEQAVPAALNALSAPESFHRSNRQGTAKTDIGNKKTHFLDRQTVDCGPNPINRFRLKTPGSKINYNFNCAEKGNLESPQKKVTDWEDDGGGNLIFLDRLKVQCDDDSLITKFHYARNSKNDKVPSPRNKIVQSGWFVYAETDLAHPYADESLLLHLLFTGTVRIQLCQIGRSSVVQE